MVKIRLKRFGGAKKPCYRIVVQDSAKPRDGRAVEELGTYQPIATQEEQIKVNAERAKYWLGVGAKPTQTVKRLLNKKQVFLA